MAKYADLAERWAERDVRYTFRTRIGGVFVAMSDAEVAVIRAGREQEAQALTGADRTRALMAVAGWMPPNPSRPRRSA